MTTTTQNSAAEVRPSIGPSYVKNSSTNGEDPFSRSSVRDDNCTQNSAAEVRPVCYLPHIKRVWPKCDLRPRIPRWNEFPSPEKQLVIEQFFVYIPSFAWEEAGMHGEVNN